MWTSLVALLPPEGIVPVLGTEGDQGPYMVLWVCVTGLGNVDMYRDRLCICLGAAAQADLEGKALTLGEKAS